MTEIEFAKVATYISAGVGKALTETEMEVYYDCLKDLDYETAKLAAKKAIIEHRWPTFPRVGEIRSAYVLVSRGNIVELTPPEAWTMAWDMVKNTDHEIDGALRRAFKHLPPLVVEAIEACPTLSLFDNKTKVSILQNKFVEIYAQLAERERRKAILPQDLKDAIEGRTTGDKPKQLPPNPESKKLGEWFDPDKF